MILERGVVMVAMVRATAGVLAHVGEKLYLACDLNKQIGGTSRAGRRF